MRHIVVSTPVSQRVDRVVNDICSLQHNNSTASRQRALRWVAHVLQDANSRQHWWFLDRVCAAALTGGEDVVELHGHIDKVVAIYCGKKLDKTPLAHLVELRNHAQVRGRPNAGRPTKYALENTPTGLRVHLWPAPGASGSYGVTADAASNQLTVPSNTLTTGTRVRTSNSGGALPGGLVANVTYYVIRIDDTHLQLAASLADAQAGTPIDLTSAGSGTNSLLFGLTPFTVLYTRPMDLAIVPNFWETVVLNGVLGTFGRHFDRDRLGSEPQDFEVRYEQQLNRANRSDWDIERIARFDRHDDATETQAVQSEAGSATTYTVPASLTGIGYVTIETGDYPLTVG